MEVKPMNLRIWITWHCSPVKLTLKPGQFLAISYCHPTEEGFRGVWREYLYNEKEGQIDVKLYSFERDCDGPMEHFEETSIRPNMTKIHPHEDGTIHPHYTSVSRSQRDHFAEAAGY